MIDETLEAIKALPKNGRLIIDAGGRDEVKTPLTTAKIIALAAELKQLREFVGAMWNVGIGELVGCKTLRGDSFYFHNGDYKIIVTGTDPFDAWQKLQGESK